MNEKYCSMFYMCVDYYYHGAIHPLLLKNSKKSILHTNTHTHHKQRQPLNIMQSALFPIS